MSMEWHYYIALLFVLPQLLFLLQAYSNYRYALSKYKRKPPSYQPRTVLIVPCKGLDSNFRKNITSFFAQDYDDYSLWFVVEEESDPAYVELCKLKNQMSQGSKAQDVQILLAGLAQSCGQKVHNLLYGCNRIGDDVEVIAFADSDISVRSDWLSHIVWPLRLSKNGAASGYRWFIPNKNNIASLALSAMNSRVAQLFGNTRFNQAWGGSMAICVEVFRQVGLEKIWARAISDDLSLSYAVKKAGMKVAFVPACLAASYESTTWRSLFEFGRRQFLITRISASGTWWFGLCISLYSVLGIWGAAILAVYAMVKGFELSTQLLFIFVFAVFFVSQFLRAILRQRMIRKLLKKDRPKMKVAIAADIFVFWVWSLLLLFLMISSAFGRTICWRGVRYKLLSPTETIIIDS